MKNRVLYERVSRHGMRRGAFLNDNMALYGYYVNGIKKIAFTYVTESNLFYRRRFCYKILFNAIYG